MEKLVLALLNVSSGTIVSKKNFLNLGSLSCQRMMITYTHTHINMYACVVISHNKSRYSTANGRGRIHARIFLHFHSTSITIDRGTGAGLSINGISGGARGVMVIVTGYGHDDTSSIPGQDRLHFT